MVSFAQLATGFAIAAGVVVAHPGEQHTNEHIRREIDVRDATAAHGARALSQCANSATARRVKQRNIQRRADKVKAIRAERGITASPKKFRRDLAALEAWEAIDHNHTGVYDYDSFTTIESIFGANTSCVLAPEVTDGPYYVTVSTKLGFIYFTRHSQLTEYRASTSAPTLRRPRTPRVSISTSRFSTSTSTTAPLFPP